MFALLSYEAVCLPLTTRFAAQTKPACPLRLLASVHSPPSHSAVPSCMNGQEREGTPCPPSTGLGLSESSLVALSIPAASPPKRRPKHCGLLATSDTRMEVMIVGAQSATPYLSRCSFNGGPVRPDFAARTCLLLGLLRLPCASVHTPPSHSVASAVALVVSAAGTRHRTQDRALERQGTRVDRASVAQRLSHWLARTRSYPSRAWLRPLHLVGTCGSA